MALTLNSLITDMELSARCRNGLHNGGIKYIRDLKNWSNSDLLKIPGFGRHSLNELHIALRENNFEILDISTFLIHKYVYNKSLLMQITVNFVKKLDQLLNTSSINITKFDTNNNVTVENIDISDCQKIFNIKEALKHFLEQTNINTNSIAKEQ